MSAFSEKIQKAKGHGFYRVADFENIREYTHVIAYLLEDQVVFDERKDILCFADTGRQLVVNVSNAETLITLFGDEPNNWAGRRVTLFLGSYGKDNKPCVRVRATTGASAQAATTAPASPTPTGANGAAKEPTQTVVSRWSGPLDHSDEIIPF
jgi:hypothetical protein